jgi:hypothetical protein
MASATVLDSLVLEIGLDPSKLVKGSKETQEAWKKLQDGFKKGFKEGTEEANKFEIAIEKTKNQVLSLLAAYLSFEAIKGFVINLTQAGTTLERLNVLTGVSKLRIAEWQNVMKEWGGTAEDANAMFGGLANNIQQFFSTGQLPNYGVYRVLGVTQSVAEAINALRHGQNPDYEKIIMQGAEAIHQNPTMGLYYGQQLGFTPQMIQHAITEGGAGIKSDLDAQKGNAEAAAKAAGEETKLTKALADLNNSFTALGHTLLISIIPQIKALTAFLDRIAGDIPKTLKGGAAVVKDVVTGNLAGAFAGEGGAGDFWSGLWDINKKAGDFILDTLTGAYSDVTAPQKQSAQSTKTPPAKIGSVSTVDGMLNLIRQLERSGDQQVSPAGAIGAFQIMPATGAHYGATREQLFDPAVNERVARAYVTDLMKKYGNLRDELIDYNAGAPKLQRFKATGYLNNETLKYLQYAMQLLKSGGKMASNTTVNHHTTTVRTGDIYVSTKSTDSKTIAHDLKRALDRTAFANQAQTGPL